MMHLMLTEDQAQLLEKLLYGMFGECSTKDAQLAAEYINLIDDAREAARAREQILSHADDGEECHCEGCECARGDLEALREMPDVGLARTEVYAGLDPEHADRLDELEEEVADLEAEHADMAHMAIKLMGAVGRVEEDVAAIMHRLSMERRE